jgi:hypothetical protein
MNPRREESGEDRAGVGIRVLLHGEVDPTFAGRLDVAERPMGLAVLFGAGDLAVG